MKRATLLCALAALVLLAGCGERAPRSTNLLLVTLDTTRADRVGCYGYDGALTPALDGLARRGVLFEQVVSVAPMTLPAHATILTGLHPPEHGLRTNGEWRLHEEVSTLAETLSDRGYRSGAFIASFTLDSRNGLDRGFELYDDDLSAVQRSSADRPLSVYRPGDAVTDAALAWLDDLDAADPFFGWVHLFDPHTPYSAHAELDGTPLAGRADYDAELAFADRQLDRLLRFLDDAGIAEHTLVVVVGDHGEGLPGDPEQGHGYALYEETLRVPLILAWPGRVGAGHRVSERVSLVDLYGTMRELLELPTERRPDGTADNFAAAALGGAIQDRECYAETDLPYTSLGWAPLRALVSDRWKYVRSSRPWLFDRLADPGETTDVAAAHPEVATEMERRLVALEGQMERREASEIGLTAEQQRSLASLGYVSGGGTRFDESLTEVAALRDVMSSTDLMRDYARAEVFRRNGRREEQAAILSDLVARSPESLVWRKEWGLALSEAGELESSLEQLTLYLQQRPDDVDAIYAQGLTRARAEDFVEATRTLGEALRLDPGHLPTRLALAMLLRSRRDPDGAARLAGTAPLEHPGATVEYALGVVLATEGRLPEAAEAFRRALADAPDDPLAARGLREVEAALNRSEP